MFKRKVQNEVVDTQPDQPISVNQHLHITEGLRALAINIDTVQLDPDNLNQGHDIEAIIESLLKFGQRQVLTASEDRVLSAGEGRVLAARELVKRGKLEWQHLAIEFTDDTPDEAREWGFADNYTGKQSSFDPERVADWLSGLDAPAQVVGLDEERVRELLAAGGVEDDNTPETPAAQVDRAEELQERWGVANGDIWQAGPHYVICGDCREPDTWRRLLSASGTGKVNGVFTSPPYAEQRKKQYGGVPVDEYVDWWEAVQELARANLADDGSFFVNIKPHCEKGERVLYVFDLVLAMRRRWGWRFVDELCWKHQGMPGRWKKRLKNQFEPVYHFALGDFEIRHKEVIADFKINPGSLTAYDGIDNRPANTGSPFKQGGKRSAEFDGALSGNVLQIPIGDAGGHAAAFPIALPDFFIRAYSDPGDMWIDPFLGSGTTICAAHQAKGGQRVGLGIERLAKYVSVCLERFVGLGLEPARVKNV